MEISSENKNSDDFTISRTKKKKDDRARQKIGQRLVELPEKELERIGLPDEIREEVLLARKTIAHGARKRQIKYIGSLLRDIDITPIETSLKVIDRGDYEQKLAFKKVENWRDQLKEGNIELISDILMECPLAERQQLSQLARNARKEFERKKGTKASRMLFRYLKEFLES